MAISASNKILASDVTTALGTKIDTAGTGLSKSGTTLALATFVTAGNAGPTANATPAFGATFTVPYSTYDAYGRVTGKTNRTVKIPAAPTSVSSATTATTATKATTVPNVKAAVAKNESTSVYGVYAPSGGTWYCYAVCRLVSNNGDDDVTNTVSKSASGGTRIWGSNPNYTYSVVNSICIRTA